MVTQAEFKIITARVDTMENSIGNIVTKVKYLKRINKFIIFTFKNIFLFYFDLD